MSERTIHSWSSLAALAVALLAAHASGVFGFSTTGFGLAVLALGLARERGMAIAVALERPRLFAALGVVYLIVFVADVLVLGRGNPVPALGRLVVFLMASEILSGDGRRAHRPVLFGLLLLVAAASQTTEIWFVVPLTLFALFAVVSQLRHALTHAAAPEAPPSALRPALRLTIASLSAGAVFFFVIPRVGAGWGSAIIPGAAETGLETGLAASVRLGAVGRVKVRRTVAFRARLDRDDLDIENLYWRARSYDRWTGDGWTQGGRIEPSPLALVAGMPVPIPPGYAAREPDLVAEIVVARGDPQALFVPGRGQWIRVPKDARVVAAGDGTIAPAGGSALRRYEVGVSLDPPAGVDLAPASGGETAPSNPVTDPGGFEPEVVAWARRVAPAGADRVAIAQALVRDLRSRTYSLDTSRIDPRRPVASFLAGAPGHCEYFATALALGLRANGVPARVVGGFLGGERATFGSEVIVRDARAHLWTEVLVPNGGWVPFDATPPDGRIPPGGSVLWMGEILDRMVVAWDTWVIGLDLGDQVEAALGVHDWIARARGALGRSAGPLAGGAVILAIALVAIRWRRSPRAGRPSARAAAVPRLYERLLAMAEREGMRPSPAETARQFARRLGGALGEPDPVFLVSALYERERFGGIPPSDDEAQVAERALARLAVVTRGARRRPREARTPAEGS